jgi:transposase
MQITRIALDLAKNVIQAHAVDRAGKPVLRKTFKRSQILPFFRDLPPCTVGMEACASAHDWGRRLQALGHHVDLLPPQYVKAFVLGQKNDANDAAAICTAMTCPDIPRVPVKTAAQQDQQALHRVRQLRMKHRTALINQMLGLLAERRRVGFKPTALSMMRRSQSVSIIVRRRVVVALVGKMPTLRDVSDFSDSVVRCCPIWR